MLTLLDEGTTPNHGGRINSGLKCSLKLWGKGQGPSRTAKPTSLFQWTKEPPKPR